jgi:hypothetical protein
VVEFVELLHTEPGLEHFFEHLKELLPGVSLANVGQLPLRNAPIQTSGLVTYFTVVYPLDTSRQFLRVVIEVKNVGNVAIRPRRVKTTVQQVLPLPANLAATLASGVSLVERDKVKIDWPVIAKYKQDLTNDDWVLEPGEKECLNLDFVIPRGLSLVQVRTKIYCRDESDAQFWEDVVLAGLVPPSAAEGTKEEPKGQSKLSCDSPNPDQAPGCQGILSL